MLAPDPWVFVYSLLRWYCIFPWLYYHLCTSDFQEINFNPQLSSHIWIHISTCLFSISSRLFKRQVKSSMRRTKLMILHSNQTTPAFPQVSPISINTTITQLGALIRNLGVICNFSLCLVLCIWWNNWLTLAYFTFVSISGIHLLLSYSTATTITLTHFDQLHSPWQTEFT